MDTKRYTEDTQPLKYSMNKKNRQAHHGAQKLY